MFNPMQLLLISWDHGEFSDIWQFVRIRYEEATYEKRIEYFLNTIQYGLNKNLLKPYQEIDEEVIPLKSSKESFIELVRNYMPNTEKELDTINDIVHFLQFDYPYYEMLKPHPLGWRPNYKLGHKFTFTQKEWKVIEKLTTATFEQPTTKGLLNSCEALLGGLTDFKALQTFKNWFYLCTEASLFWPQATEQGFSPAPKSTVWLDNIIALLKQYKTADQIPQEAIEYPYIQWFVEERPIEWVKFELKGRLKIVE